MSFHNLGALQRLAAVRLGINPNDLRVTPLSHLIQHLKHEAIAQLYYEQQQNYVKESMEAIFEEIKNIKKNGVKSIEPGADDPTISKFVVCQRSTPFDLLLRQLLAEQKAASLKLKKQEELAAQLNDYNEHFKRLAIQGVKHALKLKETTQTKVVVFDTQKALKTLTKLEAQHKAADQRKSEHIAHIRAKMEQAMDKYAEKCEKISAQNQQLLSEHAQAADEYFNEELRPRSPVLEFASKFYQEQFNTDEFKRTQVKKLEQKMQLQQKNREQLKKKEEIRALRIQQVIARHEAPVQMQKSGKLEAKIEQAVKKVQEATQFSKQRTEKQLMDKQLSSSRLAQQALEQKKQEIAQKAEEVAERTEKYGKAKLQLLMTQQQEKDAQLDEYLKQEAEKEAKKQKLAQVMAKVTFLQQELKQESPKRQHYFKLQQEISALLTKAENECQ